MNPENIEQKITERTKAIIPVHYAGQTADMSKIMDVSDAHDLVVIEDAAEAHLSEYNGRKCGGIGKIGIFSFTPSKPMTTGEGGMITTDDDEVAERCRMIRNFGDADKFKWNILGFNFRMPEVMGAIGLAQLNKLEKAIQMRREIALRYTEAFRNLDSIITPYVRRIEDTNFQLYTIRLRLEMLNITRDQFMDELAKLGVSSRLYYPSLHNQKVFSGVNEQKDNEFPNSIEFAKTSLSLPIYPQLSDGEVNYVIECIQKISSDFLIGGGKQ
jgi:perosamine synthetase